MVNKKSIWFLTLFSLILVLSIYYITMPNELLLPVAGPGINNNDNTDDQKESENIQESSILVALRVEQEEAYMEELTNLQKIMTDTKSTVEQKNKAFEQMRNLNNVKSEQGELEKKIMDEFKLKSFIKVDGDQIRVVIDSKSHDAALANRIMRTIQTNYTNPMYISVKFTSS